MLELGTRLANKFSLDMGEATVPLYAEAKADLLGLVLLLGGG